jgi:hypothetical protein
VGKERSNRSRPLQLRHNNARPRCRNMPAHSKYTLSTIGTNSRPRMGRSTAAYASSARRALVPLAMDCVCACLGDGQQQRQWDVVAKEISCGANAKDNISGFAIRFGPVYLECVFIWSVCGSRINAELVWLLTWCNTLIFTSK